MQFGKHTHSRPHNAQNKTYNAKVAVNVWRESTNNPSKVFFGPPRIPKPEDGLSRINNILLRWLIKKNIWLGKYECTAEGPSINSRRIEYGFPPFHCKYCFSFANILVSGFAFHPGLNSSMESLDFDEGYDWYNSSILTPWIYPSFEKGKCFVYLVGGCRCTLWVEGYKWAVYRKHISRFLLGLYQNPQPKMQGRWYGQGYESFLSWIPFYLLLSSLLCSLPSLHTYLLLFCSLFILLSNLCIFAPYHIVTPLILHMNISL